MKSTWTYLLLMFFPLFLTAGGEDGPVGARSMALGRCMISSADIWSAYNNQAGLLGTQGLSAGVYYENLFFVDGLGQQGIVLAQRLDNKAIAVNMSSFGLSGYRDDRYGIAYAMQLGEKLDMGVQLNYHQTRIAFQEYGNTSSVTAEIGLISHITEDFDLGFHLFNPWQAQLNEFEDERIPTVMGLGGSYTISDRLTLMSEVAKDIERPAVVRGGIEYNVMDKVSLRAGLSSEPILSSFGAGMEFGALTVDLAASYHRTLGYSTQIALSYVLSEAL